MQALLAANIHFSTSKGKCKVLQLKQDIVPVSLNSITQEQRDFKMLLNSEIVVVSEAGFLAALEFTRNTRNQYGKF